MKMFVPEHACMPLHAQDLKQVGGAIAVGFDLLHAGSIKDEHDINQSPG